MGNNARFPKYMILFIFFLAAAMIIFSPAPSPASNSLCAVVKIEIRQELTLERQAFDAHMRINNGLPHISLENVNVVVTFADEEGTPVLASSDPNNTEALFFIRADSSGITGNNNGWNIDPIGPSSVADLHWLIIPAPGSSNGLERGTLYFVGAELSYTIGGEENITKVTPDYIYVKPLPTLQLDYFLTQDVFGDDAWTPQIEPPVPFTLGVRVKNNGLGTARNLKIDSAQPKIIENEQGLLIGFAIEGSEVNGQPATKSLCIDFGDIGPGKAGVGRWIMTCTLSGSFIEFDAEVSHADELGGNLTSLIKQEDIHTHFLVKDVLVDLPGRDGIRDFLAKDGDGYKVFESECTDTAVTDLSSSAAFGSPVSSGPEVRYTLETPADMGFVFVKVADPFDGAMVLKAVVRGDGKQIKPENAWLSKTRKDPPSSGWHYHVNLFDVNTTGRYTFIFDETSSVPQAPVLQFIPDRSRAEGQQLSFIVQASDPNGTIPYLSASPLPAGAVFADQRDGTAVFDWTPSIGQAGRYFINFKASDGILENTQRARITICSIADSDCDGMDDAWELYYFGDLTRDGTGDFDGDGISDLDEFLLGTDPTRQDYGPSAPVILFPLDNDAVATTSPDLVIQNSIDPDNDPLTYEFEVFSDPQFTDLAASAHGVAETADATSWSVPAILEDNQLYYWRVRAFDGAAYSLWTYGGFFVNTSNDPPGVFQISGPSDGTHVDALMPVLEVTNASDVDDDVITYTFAVYSDVDMTSLAASGAGIPEGADGTTSWTVNVPLIDTAQYFWKAMATDPHGAQSETSPASFTVWTANRAPSMPTISFPGNGCEIKTYDVELTVENATDPDGDILIYEFELDTANTFDGPSKIIMSDISEGIDSTSCSVAGLKNNTTYYWRVRASDGMSGGPWVTGMFFVNPVNDPPLAPTLRNP